MLRCALVLMAFSAAAHDVALTPSPAGAFRFKDLLGQPYAATYVGSYAYANASVTFSYGSTGERFLRGTLTATGLKPNFAYQVKLAGRNSRNATTPEQIAAADDATNESLGLLGRWWRQTPNPANANDSDYLAHKDDPTYIYSGYLLIAFFTTDAAGAATVEVVGNNSLHVLWRTDQRAMAGNDGPVLNVTLPPVTQDGGVYDIDLGERSTLLYGEWEPTRALPGTLEMPDGRYRCDLVLTEESFHDSGPQAGNWTAALQAPLDFTIPLAPATDDGDGGSNAPSFQPLTLNKLTLTHFTAATGRDRARAELLLKLPPSGLAPGTQLSVNLLGVTQTVPLDARNRARSEFLNVRLTSSVRLAPDERRVLLDLKRSTFTLLPLTTAQAVNVDVTLAGAPYRATESITPRVRTKQIQLKFAR